MRNGTWKPVCMKLGMALVAGLLVFAPAQAAPAAQRLDAADLGAFVDGYLPIEMERADIAGMAVAVVKDGKLLLARGYGYADRERKAPVVADETLFRIGSVSKLFVWTAVMQLVEQGQLDLDADVQGYLDFPLPKRDDKPLTLRHLMTHTAGFEETLQDMWALPASSLDLREYLTKHVPMQRYPAGSTVAYSNYGATLAGYIVARRSGLSFDDYITQRILNPLGMRRTTFRQPLPDELAAQMASGYGNGSEPPQPFEYIRVAPAGSASATAGDMARFMQAELSGGLTGGPRVLQPATLVQMQAPTWQMHPQGPAMTLGYWEVAGFGQRVISHGGDTMWFHSGLYLLPEQRVGVFIVQNSSGERVLRDVFFRRFMARYFPSAPAVAKPQGGPLPQLAGNYLDTRRSEHSPLYLMNLLGQNQVRQAADGTLTTDYARWPNGKPIAFRPHGAGIWQNGDDSSRQLYFQQDEQGRWRMSGTVGMQMMERAIWYQDMGLWRAVLGGAVIVALLALLGWPIGTALRCNAGRSRVQPPALRQAQWLARGSATLTLLPWAILAVGGLCWQSADLLSDSRLQPVLWAMQLTAWLALLMLVPLARAQLTVWRTPGTGWQRAHHALVWLAGLAAAILAWQGQLLFWAGKY